MVRGKKMKRDPTLKEIVSAVVDRLLFEEDKTKDPEEASAEAKDLKDVEYEAEDVKDAPEYKAKDLKDVEYEAEETD